MDNNMRRDGNRPFNNRPNNNFNNNRNNNRSGNNFENVEPIPGEYWTLPYYLDEEKKKIKKEFISEYPEKLAGNLGRQGGKDANKKTQVRKYYDYCIRVSQKLKRCDNDYSYVEADVEELLPKVQYAKSRKVVTDLFVDFIKKNIERIHDERDFRAFLKHFEAVIAFMKD